MSKKGTLSAVIPFNILQTNSSERSNANSLKKMKRYYTLHSAANTKVIEADSI